jgi:hypothetical protein
MIKVYAEYNELYGPVVTAVKGTKSAAEWIGRVVEDALCFCPDSGLLVLDRKAANFPSDLNRRINLVQGGAMAYATATSQQQLRTWAQPR